MRMRQGVEAIDRVKISFMETFLTMDRFQVFFQVNRKPFEQIIYSFIIVFHYYTICSFFTFGNLNFFLIVRKVYFDFCDF